MTSATTARGRVFSSLARRAGENELGSHGFHDVRANDLLVDGHGRTEA